MTFRLPFALTAIALAASLGAAPAAAQNVDDIGDIVRDAVRTATRDARRAARDAVRAMNQMDQSLDRAAIRVDAARIRARVRRELRAIRDELRLHAGHGNHMGSMPAQSATDDPCAEGRSWDNDREQHCEVREDVLPAGPLTVDAGQNGGIRVEAWDQNEIRVTSIVRTRAGTEARAQELAGEVEIEAGGGRVSARGPQTSRREHWSVSYRIMVPRTSDLDLSAVNGGIAITGVRGDIRFDTRNGGVRLADLGGRVTGETRNGGLNVTLAGERWDGEGLDVETSNGGVRLKIPEGYNAELETRTVNGGFRTDYPITVQGELSFRRGLRTTLGSGGPRVSVRTTNGGLRIERR